MKKRTGPKRKRVSHIRLYIFGILFLLQLLAITGFIYLLVLYESFRAYSYIPIVVIYVIDLVVCLFLVNSRTQNDFKNTWLFTIVALPIVGIILYILFANKMTTKRMRVKRNDKMNNRLAITRIDSTKELKKLAVIDRELAPIANYLDKNCIASLYENTETIYYPYGQDGYPHILEELQKAKRFIFVESFIIEDGYMFYNIYLILREKVKQGVDVRIIYDDFGSVKKMTYRFVKDAAKDGIKCFAFNVIRPFVDVRQNSRDHRKIIVIDGVTGFAGGCNLADEYINRVERFGDWKDNFIMLKGEGVNGLTSLFLSTWDAQFRNKKNINKENVMDYSFIKNKELCDRNIKPDGFVQPFGEIPFDGEDGAKNVYLSMILKAKKYVYLSTPYLMPDSELLEALNIAAKSGIDVRIVTPGIPDKKFVYSVTKAYYSRLLASGVKIYEYTPGFNHAKMMVVDDVVATVGTINFDFRSMYLHFEDAIELYYTKSVLEVKKDMDYIIKKSKIVKAEVYLNKPVIVRIYWSIIRLFAPLL
ncbi:MAG: cardiolipin synthase [Erysipelotrichaceae bacterium]|nr:cardiolipin synthase [Erysipelotrichaceae bacterium]